MSVRDSGLKAFSDSYNKALDTDMASLRRINEDAGVPLVMTETEGLLRLLVNLVKPERILEIGTAYGYSALMFARLLPDARITTIERNPVMSEAAEKNFASRVEGRRIDLKKGDAFEVLKELENEICTASSDGRDGVSRLFDFVFIDAAKSHYREFFDAAERMCSDDAVIVCDNILMKGWTVEDISNVPRRHHTSARNMKEFLGYITEREDLEVTLLTGADGAAVIRRKN